MMVFSPEFGWCVLGLVVAGVVGARSEGRAVRVVSGS